MKKETFCEVLGDINENYVKEALADRKAKKPVWLKRSAVAACFAVITAAAVSILPNYWSRQGTTPPNDPHSVIADNSNDGTPSATDEIRISMSKIILNQVDAIASADHARYNPETDDEAVWNKEDIVAYYGTDLTPAYIPNGLTASPQNDTVTVYVKQDGSVTEDTVQLVFYPSENVSVKHGLSITASKIGLVQTCFYLLPDSEIKTSDIEGTAVTFGYRSMPYGPYDSETYEAAGYYDMYTAEFTHDGIEYQIVAEQMEVEEVVKVAASIITGEKDIAIDEGPYTENCTGLPEFPDAESE